MKFKKTLLFIYLSGVLFIAFNGARRILELDWFYYHWNKNISHNLAVTTTPVKLDTGALRYVPILAISNFHVEGNRRLENRKTRANRVFSDYYVERFLVLDEEKHEFYLPKVIVFVIDYDTGEGQCIEFTYENSAYNSPLPKDVAQCSRYIEKYKLPSLLEWDLARPSFFIPQGYVEFIILFSTFWLICVTIVFVVFLIGHVIYRHIRYKILVK